MDDSNSEPVGISRSLAGRWSAVPAADELPAEIAEQSFRNGAPVRPDPYFRRDIERLIAGIDDAVARYRSAAQGS